MEYDLQDRIILITGGNSGIGKAGAIQLAKLGATVVLAYPSQDRGARALDEVRHTAHSTKIGLMQVDMSSQDSIVEFVDAFNQRYDQLHVLIHNAAIFDLNQKKPLFTADGLETIFATNHLGPFLMPLLFLNLLKASAPSRVVTVACKELLSNQLLDIEFGNLYGELKFSAQHAYYHSKLAQVIFTIDLAERLRGTGVSVHCARVGNVAIPNERLAHLPGWMLRMYELKRKFSTTPEKMAETYVWLAADPVGERRTGCLWDTPGNEVKANQNAYNTETQKRLWAVSALLTGVSNHDLV